MKITWRKEITCVESYDVIVVGGGPAGCAAAIAAARMGVRVLMLERTAALGGMGTNGLVPAWCPFTDQEKIVYRGIALEVLERLKAQMKTVDSGQNDWVAISSEKLKRVYDDLMIRSGIEVWFDSFMCDVRREKENITEIIVINKAGWKALRAKLYIDATGDGDLAAFAGAEFVKGGEDRELQAATLCFKMANIPTDKFDPSDLSPESPVSPIYKMLQSGKYPHLTDEHLCCSIVDEGVLGFNAGHIYDMDNERVNRCSEGMMLGRKAAEEYRQGLAEYMPGIFGNACVVETAVTMGTRESRRIVGEYVLTEEDYLARRSFADEIGRNCYYLDVHGTKKQAASDCKERKMRVGDRGRYRAGESHGIPFRSLIPRGIDNMLVAGRIISCDRQVFGSIRIMPCCLVTGQAAGTAAALAVKGHMGIHGIDVEELRSVLKENGAYIH